MAKVGNKNMNGSTSSSNSYRRWLTLLILVLTIISELLSNGCSAFVFSSSLSITSTSPLSPLSIQHLQHSQKGQRKYTTKIFAQKRKPRFSQKGSHITSDTSPKRRGGGPSFKRKNKRGANSPDSNGRKRRSPRIQEHQPWESGKSIDDLESIMLRRWDTLDGSSTSTEGKIPKGFEIFNEDDGIFDSANEYTDSGDEDGLSSAKSTKKGGRESNRWRRPVLDPWDEEEEKAATRGKERNKANKSTSDREYYDQDDEGYEIINKIENDGFLTEDNDLYVPRVDHLIASRPAGGRGSNSQNIDSRKEMGGYFFNPNAIGNIAAEKDEDLSLSRENGSVGRSQYDSTISNAEEGDKNSKRRNRPPRAKPLYDEVTRNPRLLTVDEAFNQFQKSIDEGTMEVIETAEVPILAKKANSQSWDDLGITSTVLLENLQYGMNCPNPLAVQEKTTPAILTGNDVLVGTYTGSGKTLAFLVPLVQRLLWNFIDDVNESNDDTKIGNKKSDLGLSVLIVAPGRELASQIVSVARNLLEDTGLTVQMAIGGTTFKRNLEQIRKRKPNILVGTPGRIAELVVGKPGEKSGRLKVGALQSLVLDEFDALLEYEAHCDPTRAIMKSLKRRHGNSLQAVLCSATATDIMDSTKVVEFLRPGFETVMADKDDVLVTEARSPNSKSSTIATQVSRTVIHGAVHVPHKRMALDAVRKILHTEPIPQQILIFVENARKVDIIVEKLGDRGIIAAPLHGGMGSEKVDRAEVSRALREGYVGIVVATELAARGLDAPLLTHVINLDLPTDASHYAHRSGRCGRGGRPGVVINITTNPKERKVPKRFADTLGVEMFTAETREGKLMLIDPDTQVLDRSRS